MGYTLAQFNGYLLRAEQRDRRMWRREIVGQALAFSGGDGLKKLLDGLGQD